MLYKNPTWSDIPRLYALWKEVFGDSDSFLDGFFSVAFAPERARIAKADSKIIAALYILDCTVKKERLAYIYAVQTDPAFRGQGVCRGLFRDTHSYLAKNGYKGALLVPSEASLFSMYEKFGYYPLGDGKKISTESHENPLAVKKIGPREYEATRRKMLGENAVLQEGVSADFLALSEELYSGCGFLLAGHRENGRLVGTEFLGDNALLPRILCTLDCKTGEFKTPTAMYRPFYTDSPTPDYFGLSFE